MCKLMNVYFSLFVAPAEQCVWIRSFGTRPGVALHEMFTSKSVHLTMQLHV